MCFLSTPVAAALPAAEVSPASCSFTRLFLTFFLTLLIAALWLPSPEQSVHISMISADLLANDSASLANDSVILPVLAGKHTEQFLAPCQVEGVKSTAFIDGGSDITVINRAFAHRLGLLIDKKEGTLQLAE